MMSHTIKSTLPMLILWSMLPTLIDCDNHNHNYKVKLINLSTTYIPTGYNESDEAIYQWDSNQYTNIKAAYDLSYNIVYVTSGSYIHFYHINDPRNPVKLGRVESDPGFQFVDVKVCGQDLFTISVNVNERHSYCGIYSKYQRGTNFPGRLGRRPGFRVGDVARSLYVTSDCRTVVVITKGEAYGRGQDFRDPFPTVNVLHIPVPNDTSVITDQTLEERLLVNDFTDLDNGTETLEEFGVRYTMKGQGQRLSRDIDPADVTVDEQAAKIYVTLQINNAIAELDLKTADLTRVTALGFKDWRNLVIDASNETKRISFASYPIYSFYLPSSLKLLHSRNLRTANIFNSIYLGSLLPSNENAVFIITANEGAHRDYRDHISWTEIITGRQLVDEDRLLPTVEPSLRADLANMSRLGGLEFTKRYGDFEPEYNGFRRFVTLGGRGFSIFRASDMVRFYDSGDLLEKHHAQYYPLLFNTPVRGGDRQIQFGLDMQSPKKGLEPNVIELGHQEDLTLLFIGSKHPGSVTVFSVANDITKPQFEDIYMGIPTDDPYLRWDDAYDKRLLNGPAEVNDIVFLPSNTFGREKPLLLVTGRVSNTLNILEVDVRGQVPGMKDAAYRQDAVPVLVLTPLLLTVARNLL